MRSPARSTVMLALVLGCVGCEADIPGDVVGTFDVVGQLQENTCGLVAFPTVDPVEFAVEIRDDRGVPLWWRKGEVPIDGRHDDDGGLRFTTASQARVIESSPADDYPGCTVITREIVSISVEPLPETPDGAPPDAGAPDAGSPSDEDDEDPPSPLEGAIVAELTSATGSDCRPLLPAFGGPWQALPCRAEYVIEGSRRAPF